MSLACPICCLELSKDMEAHVNACLDKLSKNKQIKREKSEYYECPICMELVSELETHVKECTSPAFTAYVTPKEGEKLLIKSNTHLACPVCAEHILNEHLSSHITQCLKQRDETMLKTKQQKQEEAFEECPVCGDFVNDVNTHANECLDTSSSNTDVDIDLTKKAAISVKKERSSSSSISISSGKGKGKEPSKEDSWYSPKKSSGGSDSIDLMALLGQYLMYSPRYREIQPQVPVFDQQISYYNNLIAARPNVGVAVGSGNNNSSSSSSSSAVVALPRMSAAEQTRLKKVIAYGLKQQKEEEARIAGYIKQRTFIQTQKNNFLKKHAEVFTMWENIRQAIESLSLTERPEWDRLVFRSLSPAEKYLQIGSRTREQLQPWERDFQAEQEAEQKAEQEREEEEERQARIEEERKRSLKEEISRIVNLSSQRVALIRDDGEEERKGERKEEEEEDEDEEEEEDVQGNDIDNNDDDEEYEQPLTAEEKRQQKRLQKQQEALKAEEKRLQKQLEKRQEALEAKMEKLEEKRLAKERAAQVKANAKAELIYAKQMEKARKKALEEQQYREEFKKLNPSIIQALKPGSSSRVKQENSSSKRKSSVKEEENEFAAVKPKRVVPNPQLTYASPPVACKKENTPGCPTKIYVKKEII